MYATILAKSMYLDLERASPKIDIYTHYYISWSAQTPDGWESGVLASVKSTVHIILSKNKKRAQFECSYQIEIIITLH